MTSENLSTCLKTISRTYYYLADIEDYLKNPRKVDVRPSVEGMAEAFKEIARYCPVSDELRERFNNFARMAEESPWETVVRFAWSPRYIMSSLAAVLRELASQV